MPKVHKMLGGLIGRVRALTKKQLHDLHDDTINLATLVTAIVFLEAAQWTEFKTACEAAEPLFCLALWEAPIAGLQGDKNTCPVLAPFTHSCGDKDANRVGDGVCDWYCACQKHVYLTAVTAAARI